MTILTLGVNVGVLVLGVYYMHGSWEQKWQLELDLKVQYAELGLYPEGSGESVERVLSKRVT